MTIFLIVLGIVVLLIAFAVGVYNNLIKQRNHVDEAFSTMDVYLKKRWDIIPNLVEVTKGYASHEKETLENVIKARNMAMNSQSVEELSQNENVLSGTLKSLFALSEAYPDLKANSNFMALQTQLMSLEDDISQSRKYYNAVVKEYNNYVEMFPSNIIANITGFSKRPYFQADETERQNVKIQF